MKKSTLVLMLGAALLTACAHKHPISYPPGESPEAHKHPQLTVDATARTIAINPPILVFTRDQKDFDIVWRLPKDGKFRFAPKDGVVIEGEYLDAVVRVPEGITLRSAKPGDVLVVLDRNQQEIVNCQVRESGYEFSCRNRHTRPGVFKYTIRLTDGNATIEKDPTIANW